MVNGIVALEGANLNKQILNHYSRKVGAELNGFRIECAVTCIDVAVGQGTG